MNYEIEKDLAIQGLLILSEKVYRDKIEFPYGANTRTYKLTTEDIEKVKKFVERHCLYHLQSTIRELITTYENCDKEKVRTDDFDTLNMYFGICDVHSRIYQLPEGLLKSIALDIARYFFNRYCTIVESIKPIRGCRHVGKSEKPTGERKVSSDEIWESYRAQLKYMHSLLYGRRAKIEFTLKLIKKGMFSGWKGLSRFGANLMAGSAKDEVMIRRLGWCSSDANRIIQEGVDKFFEKNRPIVFFPSAGKLAKFLTKYCLDNMPIIPSKVFPGLDENRDCDKGVYDWFIEVADRRNDFIADSVDFVCKRYKKHVPLFCRVKFPEWAVKWVYEETVRMKKEED